MNYQGQGKLIGYRTYTKDNEQKYVYNILNGTLDSKTGLYSECEYITVVQSEQTLPELKPQEVRFEVQATNFGGQVRNRYMNVTPIAKGGKV